MNKPMPQADITIVGAGLVGALLGLQLARRLPDHSVQVLEAQPTLTQFNPSAVDPRVVALTEHSVDLLQAVGVWGRLASARVSPYTKMDVWDAEGTGRIQFDADSVEREQLGFIVENSLVVSELQQALSYQPNVQLCMGQRVKQLLLPESDAEDNFGQVQLILESGEKSATQLLLAADGAHSSIRTLAGIDARESDCHQQGIVTTITTERPHGQVARQRFMATGPLALLPLTTGAQGYQCSIVWSADTDCASNIMALDDHAFCEALTRASEGCLGQVTHADARFSFPLWQRHALTYYKPGLALVGDAAHSIHPLAGQGVNLGLKDVGALVGEIERALARDLPLGCMATLRRYQRARRADNRATLGAMAGFQQLFGADAHLLRWLRNEGLRQVDRQPLLKRFLINKAMGVNS
ncbi:UbiH/UbiF/VisC/COQ6 family ubiquinone biosynthesis hydroxylase [Simiduia sp. 21SJ11W-1]|uniref:UbiH/UbiF/VisC/COQ6 family ubiquinone biosynthesis hydroxylase n=1 Tax=Simiduia sp. 21SJ11W-1 TaxID=2909669 RepID=UPI0020A0A150|nr:UbiH/UbiF/VisC/COQ6 family ubiquinone biosynthesis hydroxylase [Simiduia sp. 21SJ11W-1]UTA48439.1 UbiH/UbiF/VisC/COQ6 family ubiquinone biosynthesis hydroxylase [Simiduia sp. 21SJ11W-1]